jgi:phosphotransferase family enzyme
VAFAGRLPVTTYMPFTDNYRFLSPQEAARQLASGTAGGPQPFIAPGWAALRDACPDLVAAVDPLVAAPEPLVGALMRTPTTFLHGDWKMGNLGRHEDGRIVLLDWDRPQIGPFAADVAWYVAVNCDRLPEGKDATLDRFRGALEQRGITTDPWWDGQVELSLLGAFLMLGWSKAGQPEELAWWEAVVEAALRRLADPGE